MAGKEKFYDVHSNTAAHKRLTQLKEWENSETNKQPSTVLPSRLNPTIKFGDSVIFQAAAHSGDIEEVERLVLKKGADVNSVNKDGLTALHQCCIDDDFEMVKTLVRLGAKLDIQDKEGWTPLHAAASCGHAHIVSYLLEHGAFPALVNNEGDSPLDLAEDYENIVDMLQDKIDKDLIDVDACKGVEEAMMLEDAKRLKNDHNLMPVMSHGGATPLHVAAAKNYLQVIKILLNLKTSQVQVDAEDEDGWTPLHAAVYWGHFGAAEELVAHGADLNKKTKAGDTIEDLCDPDSDLNLDTLRKYGEQNNRRRSNAITSQSKPRLIHSNSREDIGKHTSPQIVRRRSSKERSLFPKMDIAKEREERENFTGGDTGDFTTSTSLPLGPRIQVVSDNTNSGIPTARGNHKVNDNIALNTSSSEARDMAQDKDNRTQALNNNTSSSVPPPKTHGSTVGTVDTRTGDKSSGTPLKTPISDTPNTETTNQSTSAEPNSETLKSKNSSPKTGRKKYPGMSPRMMQRVGQWESQTSPPRSVGRAPVPMATSTPSSTEDNHRTTSTPGEPKRYSFQPKTLSPSSSSSSLPPRSFSDSQHNQIGRSNLLPKRIDHDKRGSFDDSNSKTHLEVSPEEEYRASSLPRGTKITITGITPEELEDKDISAVSTEAMATPSAHTDVDYSNSRDFSREVSVESNTSSRGASEDSETSRRNRARRTRQSRKPTQPVPSDIIQQIIKHDEIELSKSESKAASEVESIDGQSQLSSGKGKSSSTEIKTTEPSKPGTIKVTSSSSSEKVKKDDKKPISMSSYRPSQRPASKILDSLAIHQSTWPPSGSKSKMMDAERKMKLDLGGSVSGGSVSSAKSSSMATSSSTSSMSPSKQQKKSASSSSSKIPHATDGSSSKTPHATDGSLSKTPRATDGSSSKTPHATDGSSSKTPHATDGSSSKTSHTTDDSRDESVTTPPMHPRTKSTTRRRPKEKRRSTGIVVEVLDGEEVPDELANLVRKSGDGAMSVMPNSDHSPQSSFSEDLSDSLGDNNQGDELIRLQGLLADERARNKCLEKELEDTKGRIMELNRRYQDATRAYEQERTENERKDMRIQELQNNSKTLQELKHENQRMKDENSALIRVIGKLSRSPLPQAHST